MDSLQTLNEIKVQLIDLRKERHSSMHIDVDSTLMALSKVRSTVVQRRHYETTQAGAMVFEYRTPILGAKYSELKSVKVSDVQVIPAPHIIKDGGILSFVVLNGAGQRFFYRWEDEAYDSAEFIVLAVEGEPNLKKFKFQMTTYYAGLKKVAGHFMSLPDGYTDDDLSKPFGIQEE